MKLGQIRNHLPESNMPRDMQFIGYWIPTMITFMLNFIPKKITKTSMRFKFIMFMSLKEYKTSTSEVFEN